MGTLSSGERCPPLQKHPHFSSAKSTRMGNSLKALREAAGLTQIELAALADTTKNQLIKLENGSRRLSDHWAERLAPHLGVQPYELFIHSDLKIDAARLVPLIGSISCGDWREAVEHPIAMVPTVAKGIKVFALRASGDSMDQLIEADGYIYVDPDDCDLIDGKVYAVMNGDSETTAKKYRANPARLVPCSNNPAHKPIEIGQEPFTVIGRVVGTYSPL